MSPPFLSTFRPATTSVLAAALAAFFLLTTQPLPAAEPRVDLEVALESGAIPTDARAWTDLLTKAGFTSVRIRTTDAANPALETLGTPQAPNYKVVGILTTANQLVVPRARFTLNDRAAIEQWLKKLRDGGEDGVTIKPVAFGLLPKQLVEVHQALGARVESSTSGRPSKEVAKQIADRLKYKFIAEGAAQRALASDEPVADELQGVTSGTALAAVLRPLGLAMFPERNGPDIRLRIAPIRDAKESWPLGWPPQGNPRETLPEFFKYLKVEINNTPLSEVLVAIAGRVKAPLLIDHNALARDRIDLTKPVSYPATSTYYAGALNTMLFSARLKYELRVDEAEKPLLWITTVKQ